ncbi:MAG: ECF transporter S component [Oscillospiraceae bacterium]|nr:ECF transporter S component [Oscillospiraceae bacterium]
MDDKKLRKLVLSALLAALCCVATMVVQIPSPMQGYVNLGDCFVLLSGWMLGPWYGFAAGGIGSMLADVLLGYAHYAPGTLVIKGLMAMTAALILRRMNGSSAGRVLGGVAAELLMVAGYFGYASLLLGKGLAAAASIPGNLVQGAAGLAAGLMLMAVMVRSQLTKKLV